jgi:hypothetical protein
LRFKPSMKLTLRDLFWLALLIASLTVWAIEHRKAEREISDVRRRSWFIRIGEHEPSDAERQSLAAVKKIARLTDEQLDQHFASLTAADQYYHVAEYEPCLTEMTRRGMSAQLQKHYDELLARRRSANQFPFDFPSNLELLTALRRAQKEPDSFQISLQLSNRFPYGNKESAPMALATITNADIGKESALFKNGGDSRGGRSERWRVVLSDEQGRHVADSNFNPMMGGGLCQVGPLRCGDAEGPFALDLRRYVAPPRSGKYQLQVLYHNQRSIASEQDLTGLIVSKSEPIWVTVHNLDEAESRQLGMRPHPALAILAACALLFASSLLRPASPSQPQREGYADAKQTVSTRLKISRRDWCWSVLIVAVALGFWIDHQRQEKRIARTYEDAKARWTITHSD